MKKIYIDDSYGVVWCWDGKRVYVASEESDTESGYLAESYEEAAQILSDGGYLRCAENRLELEER